jgi:transcriptional regulator with XRE-family HTH domain
VILHRDGPSRRTAASRPASVPDLARVLRQARAARGLELYQVSQQTGISLDQLRDLESGTVDRLPDRVGVLKALSRYASFLDLPGDQFVMVLVEHWPAASGAPVVVVHDGPGTPPAAPATRQGAALSPAEAIATRAVPLSIPSHGAPPTSVGLPIVTERHDATAQVPLVVADTGQTPAVRRRLTDGFVMVVVRALIVISLVLILLGAAWLVVNKVRPQWLADLHLPYTSSGPLAGPAPNATQGTSAPGTGHPAKAPSMRLVSANGTQATFSVSEPLFEVRISASGGDTWVQAVGPASSTPLYVGTLRNGQSQLVQANHQLIVRIGSIAARITVQVNHKVVGTYVPPAAPFMMTFTGQ